MPLINAVFLFFAGQGLLLSFLLYQQKKIKANPWISLYFLGFSLILIYWTVASIEEIRWQLRVIEFAIPIQCLLGPFLYFSVVEKHKITRFFVHLVPAILTALLLGPAWLVLLLGFDIPESYVSSYTLLRHICYFSSLFSMIVYSYVSWRLRHTTEHMVLIIVLLIFGVGYTAFEALSFFDLMAKWLDYLMSMSMILSFYAAGYYYLTRYKPYSNKLIARKANYVNSIERIETHFQEKEVFLNPEYTLENLAAELNESATKLSQAISVLGAANFKEYLNQHRICRAKELLLESDDKLLAIALESGYNNAVSFSQNFKKFCQMTPGEYREQHKDMVINV